MKMLARYVNTHVPCYTGENKNNRIIVRKKFNECKKTLLLVVFYWLGDTYANA